MPPHSAEEDWSLRLQAAYWLRGHTTAIRYDDYAIITSALLYYAITPYVNIAETHYCRHYDCCLI